VALENTNPANLEIGAVVEAFGRYGTEQLRAHIEQLESLCHLLGDVEPIDDFVRCGIRRPEDIRDLFVDRFYFGCETDDPIAAWAFGTDEPWRGQAARNDGLRYWPF
jgi:hypothetical protein